MKTMTRFEIGHACRVGVLSSFIAAAASASGQEPLNLENLKFVCPPAEACTITFDADPGLQIVVLASSDLECWVFAGGCSETSNGCYQLVDFEAEENTKRFYQFGVFDPEVPLPPQFEQLRGQMGDEQFAEWLQSNLEQFGTLQGFTPEQIAELDEYGQGQAEEIEAILDTWLKDFHNEAALILPELEMPTQFEEIRVEWGDYDLGQLLVDNLNLWENLQGVCEPLVIEWEEQEPVKLFEFQNKEEVLELWLEDYVLELPPFIQENFAPEEHPLPPQLEQLRQELGDEAFAQWLESNLEQFGNHQGVDENSLPEDHPEVREQFETVETALEAWLVEFEKSKPQ